MKFKHRYVIIVLCLAGLLAAGSVAAAVVCNLFVRNLSNHQISIRATAVGQDLSSVMLAILWYQSEDSCEANLTEMVGIIDNPTWAPGETSSYDETFTQSVPEGKWYKVTFNVGSHTEDGCSTETDCSTWRSPVPTTSNVAIVLLVLLLAVAGIVLLKRTRLV